MLLWFAAGLAVVAGLLLFAYQSLAWHTVASHRTYIGELSPESDPIVVTLPEGALLGEVLVGRNEQVKRGQTVATLDVDAMAEMISQLETELLHQGLLRDCLLAGDPPAPAPDLEASDDVQTARSLALEECRNLFANQREIQERLDTTRETMRHDRDVVEQHIGFLATESERDLSPDRRQSDARRALALALLRSQIDARIAAIELRSRRQLSSIRDEKIRRVNELSQSIEEASSLRRRLQSLTKKARLLAPEDGNIVRVRRIRNTAPLPQDAELIEIRPNHHRGYRAYLDLPETEAAGIDVGDEVSLRLVGQLFANVRLRGQISALGAADRAIVRASIALDDSSIASLDDPKVGIALRGEGTASSVRVRKGEFKALDALRDQIVQTILPSADHAFIMQVIRNAASIPLFQAESG